MNLTKKKNDAGSIRKVWNNDKTRCYGVVGVIRDLIQSGILEYSDYDNALWCFIPAASGPGYDAHFGKTCSEALELLDI